MSKITELMSRKPSLKYRDVRNYEGEFYDWAAGKHLLKKGTSIHELFHPQEHDIRFIKNLRMPMCDGVKILTDVSKDNHGKHIIHCGGQYKSYLQIGLMK